MKVVRLCLPVLLLLVLVLAGCAAPPPTQKNVEPEKTEPEVPGWLTKMPVDDEYFYAIGVSGPTRNPKDAWEQAARRARVELGKTVISYVASISSSRTTTRGQYVEVEETVISEAVLKYSETVGRWVDKAGEMGFKNHYYILIRMDKRDGKGLLVQ